MGCPCKTRRRCLLASTQMRFGNVGLSRQIGLNLSVSSSHAGAFTTNCSHIVVESGSELVDSLRQSDK